MTGTIIIYEYKNYGKRQVIRNCEKEMNGNKIKVFRKVCGGEGKGNKTHIIVVTKVYLLNANKLRVTISSHRKI